VPKKFLQKIIQDLIRSGLVKSKPGECRGYTLARSPERISFSDVIAALEGPIAVNAWDAASKYSGDSNKQLQSTRRNRQSSRSSNQRSMIREEKEQKMDDLARKYSRLAFRKS
jgi:Rrf2 family protein